MKKIFILLLFPFLLLSQTYGQPQNSILKVGFTLQSNEVNPLLSMVHSEGVVELTFVVEIFFTEYNLNQMPLSNLNPQVTTLPKYLSTFSLLRPNYSFENQHLAPQNRLNRLLAANNPRFPKENTIFTWLNSVNKTDFAIDKSMNIPEGFGPRIII